MSNEPEKPEMPSDAEIDARFSKLKENWDVNLDDADTKLAEILGNTTAPKLEAPDFDDRLNELESKAQQLKERREAQKVQAAKEVKSTQMANDGLGMGMTLMYTVLGLPLLGGIIGMFLDKATGGNAWIVIFGMGGMVLGIGCAVFLLYRKNGK